MEALTTAAEERFELWRRRIGLVLAPLVGLLLAFLPLGLEPKAHALAAIFGFTIVLWITEAVPMAVASLMGPALLVICGVGTMQSIFSAFAHPIIFIFLGSFLLAEAMQKHGLDRRLALTLMALPGVAHSPGRMLAALGGITAVLSMWMSNTAITAVMLPIVLGVFRAQPELARQRAFAAALILMVAFSASIGGLATPVGTPTNLVAFGQLEQFGLPRPSFFQWMRLGVPLMLLLLAVLWLILRPRGEAEFSALAEEFRRQRGQLPRFTLGEGNTAAAFFVALGLWLYPGIAELIGGNEAGGAGWMKKRLPEELVGLCAGLLLFVLPVKAGAREFTLEWRDTARLEWGVLLMFGGGFALGQQIRETGLSEVIGHRVAVFLNNPSEGLLVAVAIAVSLLLSEATSNTASANVMVPLMIGVAQSTGADPARVAMATCLACSLGFMLPISTPPNALAYGTKMVPLPTMLKYGLMLDVAGGVAVWCLVRWIL